jgi:alpha-galactosidase
MKLFTCLGFLSLLILSPGTARSADLSGTWVAEMASPDGSVRKTYFRLKQEGTQLTGKVSNNYRDTPIAEGTVNGDAVSFAVGPAGNPRRTQYEGKLTGDELRLTVKGGRPGGGPPEMVAHRTSENAGMPPPRIEPPALHPVPDNGLARTPPMGWNSWNHFHRNIDDATVREIADAMAKNGMKQAGYIYVNIDDTWEAGRDAQGNIQTNKKFPDMKALADYVHGKGLKLGIYSGPGPLTCAGYEGSYGHEAQDAKSYAAWGIDYLKYDWCSASAIYKDTDMQAVYQKMGEALRATGRPIVYSLCQYGRQDVWKWGPEVGGNLWRTTGDINDSWNSMAKIGFGQVDLGPEHVDLAPYAKPGHWNDPDMLEIGNGGMSDTEYRTHMSLWALLAAPLLAGNDLRSVSPATLAILTNAEVIAVDQDKGGRQGHRISKTGEQEVWAKQLDGGAQAVGLFNLAAEPAKVTVRWPDVGMSGTIRARDLWAHKDVPVSGEEYSETVPGHGVVMLRVSR